MIPGLKVVSRLLLAAGIVLIAAGCATVREPTYVYSDTMVVPVDRTYVTTTTKTYTTRVFRTKYCVGQNYYYTNFCPTSWRGTGYRACYPQRYYCW